MKHMKHHDEKGRMHHAQSKIAKKGPLVKSKAQAEAIGYSEARRHKGKK